MQTAKQTAKLIQQARQGQTGAIAALLTQRFHAHRIRVKARQQQDCLQILLESAQAVDQAASVRLIQDTIQRVQVRSIRRVQIAARQTGESAYLWTYQFSSTADAAMDITTDITAGDVDHANQPSWPNPHRPAPHDLADRSVTNSPDQTGQTESASAFHLEDLTTPSAIAALRQQAQRLDTEAMKYLLLQALPDTTDVMVGLNGQNLYVGIVADQAPPKRSAVKGAIAEMSQWQLDLGMVEQIFLAGYRAGVYDPAWNQTLSLPLSTVGRLTESAAMMETRSASSSSAFAAFGQPQETLADPEQAANCIGSRPRIKTLDPEGRNAIAAGLVLGILVTAIGLTNFLLHPLLTLVHELGHAAMNWLFGYFAIPAFDFMYGGGVTMSFSRSALIMTAIYGGLGYLFYRYWHNTLTARVLLGATLIYLICAYTPIHEILILYMGHGFELLFAIIFLYQCASGLGCPLSVERPLYGMLGSYVIFNNVQFASDILTSPTARAMYEAGKGGVLDNDFVRLARDYFHTDLSHVFIFYLLCIAVTPVLAGLLFYYDEWIASTLYRLFWMRQDAPTKRASR